MSKAASIYRETRNYENLQRRAYEGVGDYDIPALEPTLLTSVTGADGALGVTLAARQSADGDPAPTPATPLEWIGFNYARGCEEPELHGIHFFVDDYQFMRLWNNPDAYLNRLAQFACVCTPDFSTYTDFPVAVQIYNHYRKHWLGAYWQDRGIPVIPTISWSDEASFDWCFDGEPVGGAVAISSVGTQLNLRSMELFRLGYAEMIQRLNPSLILFCGEEPEGLIAVPEIVHIQTFHKRLRAYDARGRKDGV